MTKGERDTLLTSLIKKADDAGAFYDETQVVSLKDVHEIFNSTTLNTRSDYPKNCTKSDFHCSYPECPCGR